MCLRYATSILPLPLVRMADIKEAEWNILCSLLYIIGLRECGEAMLTCVTKDVLYTVFGVQR